MDWEMFRTLCLLYDMETDDLMDESGFIIELEDVIPEAGMWPLLSWNQQPK